MKWLIGSILIVIAVTSATAKMSCKCIRFKCNILRNRFWFLGDFHSTQCDNYRPLAYCFAITVHFVALAATNHYVVTFYFKISIRIDVLLRSWVIMMCAVNLFTINGSTFRSWVSAKIIEFNVRCKNLRKQRKIAINIYKFPDVFIDFYHSLTFLTSHYVR